MLSILQILRKRRGNNAISKNIREEVLVNSKDLLRRFFEVTEEYFETSDGVELRNLVYCKDIEVLIQFVNLFRDNDVKTSRENIVSVDNSKSILKVIWNCLSDAEYAEVMNQNPSNYKASGARKSKVLAAAYSVKESYSHPRLIFRKLKLINLNYKLSLDLKCLNIVSGFQSTGAKHACPYSCGVKNNGVWLNGQRRIIVNTTKFNAL